MNWWNEKVNVMVAFLDDNEVVRKENIFFIKDVTIAGHMWSYYNKLYQTKSLTFNNIVNYNNLSQHGYSFSFLEKQMDEVLTDFLLRYYYIITKNNNEKELRELLVNYMIDNNTGKKMSFQNELEDLRRNMSNIQKELDKCKKKEEELIKLKETF